jgi:iron complex outermembrane recepter protein
MVTEDIAIPPGNVINIAMITDLATFEEVVVTALGISRERKTLGYSATSITGDEVAVSSTISPVNALQGRISGVDIQPTDGGTFGGSRITIRGNSVLGENNQPIFVVDGVIYDNQVSGGSQWGGVDWGNQLKSLNPDEFESVTVLKRFCCDCTLWITCHKWCCGYKYKAGSGTPGNWSDIQSACSYADCI